MIGMMSSGTLTRKTRSLDNERMKRHAEQLHRLFTSRSSLKGADHEHIGRYERKIVVLCARMCEDYKIVIGSGHALSVEFRRSLAEFVLEHLNHAYGCLSGYHDMRDRLEEIMIGFGQANTEEKKHMRDFCHRHEITPTGFSAR